MITTPTFRTVAATSALALAAAGSALLASPAVAAESQALTYTCEVPLLGAKEFTATYKMADTVPYGGTVSVDTTVVVPADVSETLYSIGTRRVEGEATAYGLAAGLVEIGVPGTVPSTAVPQSGPLTVVAQGGVALNPNFLVPAGSVIDVDAADRQGDGDAAVDLRAVLRSYGEDGAQRGEFNIPCELNDGQTVDIGAFTVVKADTKTKAALKAKKGKSIVAKATVTPETNVVASGVVKLVVKRNGKKVGAEKVTLNDKGKASAKFAKAKKGKYTLVAKYLGNKAENQNNFNGSKGKATKKV